MNDEELFQKFADQLAEWSGTGKEPELGDWNIRAYLDMQEHRLKSKEITRIFEYKPYGHATRVGDSIVGNLLNSHNKRLNCAYGEKKIQYVNNGKTIFRENTKASLFQLIKHPSPENEEWKNETYICPNCSNIVKIEELESEGCSYCGTKFLMSQLYPKVTNYYILENMPKGKFKIKDLFGIMIVCFLLVTILLFFLYFDAPDIFMDYDMKEVVFTLYGGGLIWGFILFPIISMAKKSITVMVGSAGAKSQITATLQQFDPSFSYDYFEGKALSLLRMIVYADNPQKYIQYDGAGLAASFGNIVDMEYLGGLGLDGIKHIGEYIEVKLKVYMKNTYYDGGKIKQKGEVLNLQMKHKSSWKVEPEFSIVKVACHGCGGSFDATKEKNCPYCGREYDAGIDDWIVSDISIKSELDNF